MNYANIFAAICSKTQPKYANICFKTQGKFSVACRILLLLEKTPLKEHLLARADTLPYQAKRGNFAIISSFYLIFYTLFARFYPQNYYTSKGFESILILFQICICGIGSHNVLFTTLSRNDCISVKLRDIFCVISL